jgi:DNA-binding PucR family transcriptional regulator
MSVGDDDGMTWLRAIVADAMHPALLAGPVAELNEMIAAEVPEIAADRELRRDLDASTTAHALGLIDWLSSPQSELQPPAAAHALARTIARRGLPLRLLMRIYRAGHQAALRYCTSYLSAMPAGSPPVRPDSMLRLWEQMSRWLNISLELLTDTYTEERERRLRGSLTRRTETVHAILRGDVVHVQEATHLLEHPLRRQHTALALWAESTSDDGVISRLESAASLVATALGYSRVLTTPSGTRGLWAWVAGDAPPDPAALRDVELPAGVGLAAGTHCSGIDGFRRSHREALAAQRVAERSHHRITWYADVEIAHLIGADHEAITSLLHRELPGLTGPDPTARRLRETLRAYLRANRSPETAARALGVHKNTVRYRLQQIEARIGHPVDSRRLHIELALIHHDVLDEHGAG